MVSRSKKEYLAHIDVCLGGRAAEELSATLLTVFFSASLNSIPVYGPDGVSSGASADIRKATANADAMVRVSGFRLVV